jgi:hypothetical protein
MFTGRSLGTCWFTCFGLTVYKVWGNMTIPRLDDIAGSIADSEVHATFLSGRTFLSAHQHSKHDKHALAFGSNLDMLLPACCKAGRSTSSTLSSNILSRHHPSFNFRCSDYHHHLQATRTSSSSLTNNEQSITLGRISPKMSSKSRRTLTRGSSIYSDATTHTDDITNVANLLDYQIDFRHHRTARVTHLGDTWPGTVGRPHTTRVFHSSDGQDDNCSGDTQVKPYQSEVGRHEVETRDFHRKEVTSGMCSLCYSRPLM